MKPGSMVKSWTEPDSMVKSWTRQSEVPNSSLHKNIILQCSNAK